MVLGIRYFVARNWERIAIGVAGIGVGWKPTRAATLSAIRWSATAVVRPIMIGVGTAALNVARVVVLPLATGYTIGAVTGTVIAEYYWGEEGKRDAIELYTGQVSWDQYWNTLGDGLVALMD